MSAAASVCMLNYSYPNGRVALTDLSFEVSADETVGVLGPNGAGKTTLFLAMCGVLKTTPGSISIGGLDPADPVQRRSLPAAIGIVFQNSDDQLFGSTLEEDVAFGPLNLGLGADEVKQRVAAALARVGLTGQEQRVPFQLSGGEKRRAALAGVLAMRPGVLLLDEPSMFLDPRGRSELITLLGDLPGTKFIAAHDLSLVRRTCSRVLVIDEGKLVADGPTESVMDDRELMERHGLI